MEKIQMTEREKEIVTELNHELYTAEYLEHWINRNDSVALNASAALQAMGAHGFYEAVKLMAAGSSKEPVKMVEYLGDMVPEKLCTVDRFGDADDFVGCMYCFDGAEAVECEPICETCVVNRIFQEYADLTGQRKTVLAEGNKQGSSHGFGKWIPCSERLPENNNSVLVWLESRTIRGSHIHSIGGYQNNAWFIRSGVETESYPNLEWNVIAWMPLPDQYK